MFALQTSLSQLLLEVSAKVAEIAAVQYFVVIETPYERKFGGNKQLCELFMEEELNRDSDADTDGQFSFRDSNKTREQDQHVSNNLKQKRKIKIKPPKEPQSKKTASSTQQKRKRKAEGEIDPKDSGLTEPKQFDQDFEIKTETFDDFQVSCIEEGDLESGMKFQPEADDVLSGFPNQDIQNSEILKVQPVHLKEDRGMGTKTQLGIGVDEGASDFLDLDMDMVQTENAEELNDKVQPEHQQAANVSLKLLMSSSDRWQIQYDGYTFSRNKGPKGRRSTTYWQCVVGRGKHKCKGTLVTTGAVTPETIKLKFHRREKHDETHSRDTFKCVKREFLSEFRQTARLNPRVPCHKIFDKMTEKYGNELQRHANEAPLSEKRGLQEVIPEFCSVRNRGYRVRRKDASIVLSIGEEASAMSAGCITAASTKTKDKISSAISLTTS